MATKILLFTVIKPEIILETRDSEDLVFKTNHWLLLELQIKPILLIWINTALLQLQKFAQ